jgi:hypothetical protein
VVQSVLETYWHCVPLVFKETYKYSRLHTYTSYMCNKQLFGLKRVEYGHICDCMWLPTLRIFVSTNVMCCRVLQIYTKSCTRTRLKNFWYSLGIHFLVVFNFNFRALHPAGNPWPYPRSTVDTYGTSCPRFCLLHHRGHMGRLECLLELRITLQLPPESSFRTLIR